MTTAGFPHSETPDQSLVDDSPGTIVASHVLHRFLVPRHPPCALKNLATDARVHCAVLKQRPTTHHPAAHGKFTGAGTEGSHDRPNPQTPNSVPGTPAASLIRSTPRRAVLEGEDSQVHRIINVPPMSNHRRTSADVMALDHRASPAA